MSMLPVAALFAAAAIASLALATGASAAYDPHSLIVKFKPGVSPTALDTPGLGRRIGPIDGGGAYVFSTSADAATLARAVSRSRLVEYAEVNKILTVNATPNDPMFPDEYGLNNTGQTGGTSDADIDAPEGWDAAGLGGFPTGGGVKVGIVDTGIDQTHPDLSGQLAGCAQSRGLGGILGGSIQVGSCTDDNDHGTHVSGTIAAKANNGIGVAGVAFNSRIVMCRALGGPLGTGNTGDVANCINWVHQQGAKVISMSLGGGASTTLQN